MTKAKNQNTKNRNSVVFDGNEYTYSDIIDTNGDSIRTYYPVTFVKPGQLYTIKHVSSPDGTLRLLTREETGQLESGQEVRISPTSDWGKTLIQAFPRWLGQFEPSTDYSLLPWWKKPIYKIFGYKHGGWLQKYQNGGMTQLPSQEQVMKELLAIVQQAATELLANKPGQGVQTLAQIANDPQGSQLLDALVQQVPEAGQVVEDAMKMIGAFKCGGKTKKKVKKGAKGCVPCKKLMRVGGKLINVWSDCEGNIISKHLVGGRLIPKAEKGLTEAQLAMLDTSHDLNWAKEQAAFTSTKTAKKDYAYYIDNGQVYKAIAQLGLDGSFRWVKIDPNTTEGKALTEAELSKANISTGNRTFTLNGNTLPVFSALGDAFDVVRTKAGDIQYYHNGQWNTASAIEDGTGGYFWSSGRAAVMDDFGDDDMRTGLTKADLTRGSITADLARAAGIDVSQFDVNDKYQISSNPLLGTKPDATTALNTYGSMGLARQLQRQKRNVGREAWIDARARNRLKRSTDVVSTYKDYKDKELTRIDHDGQVTAAINAIDAKYKGSASSNPNNTAGSGSGSGSGGTTATTNIKPIFQTSKNKQGGWLTKFN